MSIFKEGIWQIEAVLVNKATVLNNEGFIYFEYQNGALIIQPAGMRFEFEPETMHSAVLNSNGQTYFADWTVDEDKIELILSRPQVKDTISIYAKLEPAHAQVPTYV